MKSIKYISIFCLLLSWSCRKEIDIDVPNNERKIVVNALLETDSLIDAYVFRSNHAQDNNVSLLYLNNAKVDLFKDGSFLETLALDTLGCYKSKSNVAEAGSKYEFSVEVPNLKAVKGKTETVEQIPIIRIDSIGQTNLNDGDQLYIVYEIVFQDPPEEDNFYRLKCRPQFSMDDLPGDTIWYDDGPDDYYVDYPYYYYNSQLECIDPSLEIWPHLDDYHYFSDVTFNGDEKGFQVAMPVLGDFNIGFYASLEHVNSDFYRYIKSVSDQNDTEGMSLFYQAVQVFVNVDGGYGIIGATTADVDSLIYEINFDEIFNTEKE